MMLVLMLLPMPLLPSLPGQRQRLQKRRSAGGAGTRWEEGEQMEAAEMERRAEAYYTKTRMRAFLRSPPRWNFEANAEMMLLPEHQLK